MDGVLNMNATCLHGPDDAAGSWPGGTNEHRHVSYVLVEVCAERRGGPDPSDDGAYMQNSSSCVLLFKLSVILGPHKFLSQQ